MLNLNADDDQAKTIPYETVKFLNQAQYSMFSTMNGHSLERNAKYDIHVLRKFFDIRRIDKPVILGSFSWSSQAIKTKWLSEPHVSNFGGGYVTPGDLARDYLALKYPNRRIRCTTAQWKECVGTKVEPPLYCNPCRLESASYLDLSGAFWQIVRNVGWDVGYLPGKFLISNSRMTDFPYSFHKMARNCLVSVGIPAPMRLWNGHAIEFIKKPSKFVNMILWRLVQDVLNSVAADMVDAGCVYVYTDGYILPDDKLRLGFEILESWGLDYKIKMYGQADIVTPANYAFWNPVDGFRSTKVYQRRRYNKRRFVDKIYRGDRVWLRTQFKRFADYARREWEFVTQEFDTNEMQDISNDWLADRELSWENKD